MSACILNLSINYTSPTTGGIPTGEPIAYDWQVSAATEFLNRHDVIVITATGSGKSLSYLLELIANPGRYYLLSSHYCH